VKNGVLKGLSRSAASRAGGGSGPVVPGSMDHKVALAQPHLMKAASKEFGETHKGGGSKRGEVCIVRRWMGKSGQMQEEDYPRFFFQDDIQVRGGIRREDGQGRDQLGVRELKEKPVLQQGEHSVSDLVDRVVFANSRTRSPSHKGAEGRI